MGKFNNEGGNRGGDRGGDRGRGRGGDRGGGRGRGRGDGKRGPPRGAPKVFVQQHRLPGVYIARGPQDAIVTKNLVPGESVYNEKRITVENNGEKIQYRVWNPYRSKIAASVLGGISETGVVPGAKVLYLGAASGTTVSHVSDIIGPQGVVYAVQFSHRVGRDLINMAKKRTNVIPIIHDARKPQDYRFLVGIVDLVFADVAQPDQARIIADNAKMYLKNGGKFLISLKANCIDSTNEPEIVFANEVNKLKQYGLKPKQQLTLEPYERDHAMILGTFRE